MKQTIAVAALLAAGIPGVAHAQSVDGGPVIKAAPTPKAPDRTPDPDYKPATEFFETTKDTTGVISAATKCGIMIAKYNSLLRYIQRLEETEKFLGAFSTAVSTTSILIKASTGDREGLIADAQDAVQDLIVTKGACALLGKVFCPVYEAGMTVGEILNYAPKVLYGDINEQTIKEVVTDYYAPIFGDIVYGKPTVAQVEARVEQMRAENRKARASAQRAMGESLMCKKAEAKSAVEDILAKAKAKAARPVTPLDSGLSAETDAAIRAGKSSANNLSAAGSSQFLGTMQSMQQEALQQQAMQRQAQQQALQQQALQQQALQQQAQQSPSSSSQTTAPTAECQPPELSPWDPNLPLCGSDE